MPGDGHVLYVLYGMIWNLLSSVAFKKVPIDLVLRAGVLRQALHDKVCFIVQSLTLFIVIPKGPHVLLPVPRKTRSRSVKNVADAKFAGKTTPAH